MDDSVNLTFKNRKKQRRIRCIVVIVVILVAFIIGFLIGFFVKKSPKEDHSEDGHQKSGFQEQQEKIAKHHQDFMDAVSPEELENYVK